MDKNYIKGQNKMMKMFIASVLCFVMIFPLTGCSSKSGGLTDEILELFLSEDEHVLGIKNAENHNYPGITYEDAFESFFSNTNWKYFSGSTQSEPDVKHDIVEFSGRCLYLDTEVTARIQFTYSDDGSTFQATYLSFNEVPQNLFMLAALIDKSFSEYQSK